MSKSKIIIKNFVLLFSSNIIGQLFYLGGLIHLARVLGPGGFGLWNFAQAWLMYLFRGGEMGLEAVGVRAIARNPEDTPKLISAIVVSRCLLAIILFVFLFLAITIGWIPKDSVPLMIAFSLAIIPMAFILEWVFEGHQSLLKVSIARVAKGILFFLLIVAFVHSANELSLSAVFYALSITLPILYVGWFAIRRYGAAPLREIVPLLPYLWKSALPVGSAAILSSYNLFLGTMVIGYTMQHDQLGYYTASHRIVIFLWAYIISNLQRVVLPTLTTLHQSSADSFKAFVEKFLRYAAFLSLGVGLCVAAFSSTIIHVLYSHRYDMSIPILQILVWAFSLASIRMILEIALLASERQKMYFYGMIFLSVMYTIFTPWLVSLYGINGAAYAAIIAEAAYMIFLLVLWSRERASDIWNTILKYCFAASLAILVLTFIQSNIIITLFCATALYLIVLHLLKAFSISDLSVMYSSIEAVVRRKG